MGSATSDAAFCYVRRTLMVSSSLTASSALWRFTYYSSHSVVLTWALVPDRRPRACMTGKVQGLLPDTSCFFAFVSSAHASKPSIICAAYIAYSSLYCLSWYCLLDTTGARSAVEPLQGGCCVIMLPGDTRRRRLAGFFSRVLGQCTINSSTKAQQFVGGLQQSCQARTFSLGFGGRRHAGPASLDW